MIRVLVVIVAIVLVACGQAGTQPADIPGSGATRGEALFELNSLGNRAGCASCHSLEPGVRMVGPSLADIAIVAETQDTGLSAEAYLERSLLQPDVDLPPGYAAGAMPAYGDVLNDQDVDDLVAYMMTLDGAGEGR